MAASSQLSLYNSDEESSWEEASEEPQVVAEGTILVPLRNHTQGLGHEMVVRREGARLSVVGQRGEMAWFIKLFTWSLHTTHLLLNSRGVRLALPGYNGALGHRASTLYSN